MDTARELPAILATVEDYVTGMARGDAALLAGAMHPNCRSVGHYGGALEWEDRAAFAASCAAHAVAPGTPVPPHEIESLSFAGDTVCVRDVNVFAGQRFRDTLVLLKGLDGRWSIVSKVFAHLGPA
jgi:hypothetical protein